MGDVNSDRYADDESPDGDGGESSDPSDGQQTHGTSKRWWLTNDILAFCLLFGTFAVAFASGLGWLDPQTIPEGVTWAIVVAFGTAIAWAFGKDAVEAWRGGK